ncbi:leucyl aminopeptidase [Actinomadura sp. HBU206391]|uniref:leucyl aminopeptidase n=1 Tax=Actinomadura sp. HBU206391 TaxID=2731692 RepID=UPI00164FC9D4|nr:leucyl aminopeptidase [Actinomadura sp. HBU206391]MBC6457825.1 leucyl aminopeptidase [Actinomadura sp. HBU206391]
MPVETQLRAVEGSVRQAALAAGAVVLAVPVKPGPEADTAELADLLTVETGQSLAYHEATGDPGEVISVPLRFPGEPLPRGDDAEQTRAEQTRAEQAGSARTGPGQSGARRAENETGGRMGELLLYGVGDASPSALRRAGAALTRRCKGRATVVVEAPEGDLSAFVEGALLAAYDFRAGEPRKKGPVGTILVSGAVAGPPSAGAGSPLQDAGDSAEKAVARGAAIAGATALARDLTNTPSVDKSPAWLADRAQEIAAESGLTVRIRDEEDLRTEGFGGLIAVGAGSPRPPRLIELSHEPEDHTGHIVLVGKGITFDTGGLSLKRGDNMKTMKTDMAGGAVVMAVMSTLRSLGVRVRVTGLVAAAENMPSGSAMRPSDVITHYGGITSEVLNTDAEGRLVLADALAYADARLNPDLVVDIATLTGAAKVALGLRQGALFATDDELAAALVNAGEASGERLWRMPLVEDYREAIDSDVADVANIERRGFGGGSIMAALFLREFAGKRRWAHLDVAGPARATSDEGEISKGATGFGVRLLLHWLDSAPRGVISP